MGFKKLALIPMFMILSAGMPILAEETEVQEPVVEQTETTLGWNETHDMYTKEDGSFAIGWQEIDQEMYYFNESGILQCDQWIDNHYVGLDGKMAKNQWINDRYVDSNGLCNRIVGSIMISGCIAMVMERMLKISLKLSMVLHIILMQMDIW